MHFKLGYADTHQSVVVDIEIKAEDRKRIEEYVEKVEALTKDFFFTHSKTFIPVYLEDHGPNKLMCIKTVRECLNCGLKEAKDLVEAPKPVCLTDGMPRAQAIDFKNKLVAAGAIANAGAAKFHVMG